MSSISSYADIIRRKKEIELQKEFLWEEISQLHKSDSSQAKSYWVQQLMSIDPAIILQTWKIAVQVRNYFKSDSPDED